MPRWRNRAPEHHDTRINSVHGKKHGSWCPVPSRQRRVWYWGKIAWVIKKDMHYTYVLKSLKDKKLYIGRSDDLKRRIDEHKKGKVEATKYRLPIELIFYEAFKNKTDAIRRENYFKTTKGKRALMIMLKESVK